MLVDKKNRPNRPISFPWYGIYAPNLGRVYSSFFYAIMIIVYLYNCVILQHI